MAGRWRGRRRGVAPRGTDQCCSSGIVAPPTHEKRKEGKQPNTTTKMLCPDVKALRGNNEMWGDTGFFPHSNFYLPNKTI